jgi:hypothetical protein
MNEHCATSGCERLALRDAATSCCGGELRSGFAAGVYSGDENAAVPEEAAGLSFGCGSPTRHAGLHDGEVVLDLGCGAGTDLVLAAGMVARGGSSTA